MLRPDGKPMRALRVLAMACEPLHEDDVWRQARRPFDMSMWHAPLRTLVERGLAERTGRRGGYRYSITDAGREALRHA